MFSFSFSIHTGKLLFLYGFLLRSLRLLTSRLHSLFPWKVKIFEWDCWSEPKPFTPGTKIYIGIRNDPMLRVFNAFSSSTLRSDGCPEADGSPWQPEAEYVRSVYSFSTWNVGAEHKRRLNTWPVTFSCGVEWWCSIFFFWGLMVTTTNQHAATCWLSDVLCPDVSISSWSGSNLPQIGPRCEPSASVVNVVPSLNPTATRQACFFSYFSFDGDTNHNIFVSSKKIFHIFLLLSLKLTRDYPVIPCGSNRPALLFQPVEQTQTGASSKRSRAWF